MQEGNNFFSFVFFKIEFVVLLFSFMLSEQSWPIHCGYYIVFYNNALLLYSLCLTNHHDKETSFQSESQSNTPMGWTRSYSRTDTIIIDLPTEGAMPTSRANFFGKVSSSFQKSREWIIDSKNSHPLSSTKKVSAICMT